MDNQHRKITGYRDLTQAEIDGMNRLKALEAECGAVLEEVERLAKDAGDGEAGRWASLGRTNLETGFMYAIKAIARPTNGLGRRTPAA